MAPEVNLSGMAFLRTVRATIDAHKMISKGESILVALSGGSDSVALLHVLWKMRRELKLQLGAVYINHQIRKAAAKKEELFCRKLCDNLKVRLHIVREDIPFLATVEKKGIEETGRNFRYRTFESLAVHHGYAKIALGHHRNDQVETILFRIIRGTGPSGLLGIPATRGKIIRPLVGVTKEDILSYLKKQPLSYCRDQSNESDAYSRNYIRNKLLPDIRKRLNPQVDQAILNLAEIGAPEEEHLQQVTLRAFRQCAKQTTGGKIELDLDLFDGYPLWLRRRLLRFCLQKSSGSQGAADRETISRLENLTSQRAAGCSLPGKLEARILAGKLLIMSRKPLHYLENLVLGEDAFLEPLQLRIRTRLAGWQRKSTKWRRRPTRVVLDASRIAGPLVVRSIRPGDRFQPLGMSGRKKVSDYLTDRKVASVYRDEIPVVCDRDGIIWLVGFEIADRVKVGGTTRKVLKFEITVNQDTTPKTV